MHFDVILIGDLRVPGGTSRHVSNEIRVLSQAGYSVGLVNVELPHARGQKPLDRLIRARVAAGEAVLVQEDLHDLAAGLVIFENPRAFMNPGPPELRIRAEHALIALHFPPHDGTGASTFEPARVLQVCSAITDAPLSWAPTSPLTRELLLQAYPGLKLMDGVVPCIVFADDFQVQRPAPRAVPVIGRHSRPQLDKWPATRKQVLQAYPARKDVEVVLLGASEELRTLMGSYPPNWRTYEFNEITPAQLLGQIDFFVYHHHPRWVEAFGMSIAEAMASGAVAILPGYMRANFGEGAIYRTPEETMSAVRMLRRDPRAFQKQARRGREHIRKHHSPAAYLDALRRFLGTAGRRRAERPKIRRHDVVILADMRRPGSEALRIAGEAAACAAAGYTTALLHAAAGKPGGRVRPEIDACVRDGRVAVADPIRHGIHTRLLVAHGARPLLELEAKAAMNLRAERTVIVVNGPVARADIALVQRLAPGGRKSRLSWAPTSDIARARLEACDISLLIEKENWRPVCVPAEAARQLARKRPAVAVIAAATLEPADLRKLKEMLPHDGTLRVRLHGAPPDKGLLPLQPLEGWETFKSSEMALGKVLDGADALLCVGGAGFSDVAAAEAMGRGMPVIATHDLRRHLGDGAIYCSPAGAAAELRKLLKSRRRYAAAAEAAHRLGTRMHAPETHRQRLAQLIGKPKSKRPLRGNAGNRRVLMVSQNGVGLGHVVRQLAVSGELSGSHEVVFCSMSQAIDVIAGQGYAVEHLPSHVYSGVSYSDWHGWARAQLEQMIDFYGVGAVVLDGSAPYLGLLEAVAPRADVRLVWIRRPMWPASPESASRLAQQRFFDLIIEPEEAAGEMDAGPTVAQREHALCVPPIRLFDQDKLLSRTDTAAALKLDPARPAVLVQLGSGTNHDIAVLTERIVSQASLYPGLQVVVAEWHNADRPLDLWAGVTCLRGFPYGRYFNAFDLSFSAAGYNSFHEIINFGLPSAFIPNPRDYMDGQGTRAAFAAATGAGLLCDGSPLGIGAALQQLMDPKVRRDMRTAMRRLRRPNGAKPAAQAISLLMQGARP